MKVRVDQERCQGHTLCAMIAPEMFALSDIDGSASAVHEVVPADQESLVLEASHSCPEQAIVIDTAPVTTGASGRQSEDLGA
jgi:ferredoxin